VGWVFTWVKIMECVCFVHRLIYVRHETDTPDLATVARAREGDVEAFGELFRQTQVRIYNFVLSMVANPADAADLTQQVYVAAWKGLAGLRSDEAFWVWLHRIALNVVRDSRKKTTPEWVPLESEIGENEGGQAPVSLADEGYTPDAAVAAQDTQAWVRKAIATLPEAHRVVVTMHHLEGMEVNEIAEVLGVPPGTVLSRLARARETLRSRLNHLVQAGRAG